MYYLTGNSDILWSMETKAKRGRGRPSSLVAPRNLSLLVPSEQYKQLEAMLAEARKFDPKIKLSDLARQVLGCGMEARRFAKTLAQLIQGNAA